MGLSKINYTDQVNQIGILLAETIFVRKATGLVREVGLLSAMLFCLSYTVQIFAPMVMVPYYAGYNNETGNLWLGLLIAFVGTIFVNSVYAHFSSAMPRSGGDYVFLGRTMHPLLGFVPNFAWTTIASFWNAANCVFFAAIVPLLLSGFYPQSALAPLTTPWGVLGLGLICWVLCALLAITGMRWFLRVQYVTWIVQFVALGVIAYYILAAAGNFPALFNAWAMTYVPTQPDMYHKIINEAVAAGFNLNPPPEGPMMERTLAWASACIGEALPYTAGIIWIAGEVKRAESGIRQHIMMEVATVLVWAVWILGGVTWLYAVNVKFMGAFYFLGGTVPELPQLSFYFWTFFPAIMPAWAVDLFALAALLILVVVAYAGVMVVSRCIFAWSFDRLIPSFFARVSDKSKQPITALAASLTIALIVLALEANVNIFTYIGAFYFMVLFNIFIVCFAGMIFPYVRKDMFEQMPLKARIGGIPLLTIISFIGAVFMVWTGTSYFTNPDYMASFGITQTMIAIAIFVWVLAFAIYFISNAYNKRRGIDLGKAFKQIPPA
jgi:amino acid transporter